MSNRFDEKDFSEEGLNLTIWKKIFKIFKPYTKYIVYLCVLNVLIALSDTMTTVLNKQAIDTFCENNGSDSQLVVFVITYCTLIVLTALAHFLFYYFASKSEQGFAYTLREELMTKLQSLPFSYYDVTPIGWLMARVTSDVMRLSENISWSFTELAFGFPMMIFSTIVMFYYNVKLAIIVLIAVPLLAYICFYFQKRILRSYRAVRKFNSIIINGFSEGIQGAKTTKTMVLEENNFSEFQRDTSNMFRMSTKASKLVSIFRPLIHFISSISIAFVLWIGGKMVFDSTIGFGTLMMFTQFAEQFFEPLRTIAMIVQDVQLAQASGERIAYLLDVEPDITDTEEVLKMYGDIFSPKEENYEEIKGDVEFRNVNFHYIENEPILQNFNLSIKAGQTIALVGETGSGKSTIVNLICRFYEPVEGELLIDGVDYRKRSLGWLHSKIGYVLQAPHLFSGTIMENIKFGNKATDEEVYEAAKLVNAHDFIMKFKDGYQTQVGEGGSRLSTGQKQLVSFARAVLANPSIFVLDEATASIDTETEKIIQYAIENIMKDKTSFVVAHRLSTIVNADRILVISDGKIIEDGNHTSLMKQKGYYYRLFTNQFKESLSNTSFSGVLE